MKLSIRVAICALAIFAAAAVNFSARATNVAAVHQATVPGPTPLCNPFTQPCPNIR